ncbi:MAG: hypothetical protein ACP5P1_06690 [Acidimicrobiales bacterium]
MGPSPLLRKPAGCPGEENEQLRRSLVAVGDGGSAVPLVADVDPDGCWLPTGERREKGSLLL